MTEHAPGGLSTLRSAVAAEAAAHRHPAGHPDAAADAAGDAASTPAAKPADPRDLLPFMAPCRALPARAPLSWLAQGWADFRRAPGPSLAYGAAIVVLSWIVTGVGLRFGTYWSALILLSGFVFVAPLLALGLYSISRQIHDAPGTPPSIGRSIQSMMKSLGTAMVYAVALLVLFLIWARAASMVHVFFPMTANPSLAQMATFLSIGTAVGAVFSGLTFIFSAFSLPMICDRDTDAVTAIVTSVNAVLRNKPAMAVWALCIVVLTAIGFATALIGLAVVIPLLGYATWHAYQDTIDAAAWPPNA
jgi:uncharacterized membrane protein